MLQLISMATVAMGNTYIYFIKLYIVHVKATIVRFSGKIIWPNLIIL